MDIVDMYLEEVKPSAEMIRHSRAAKRALILKDIEKERCKYISYGGFKAVAPKLEKRKKTLKDYMKMIIIKDIKQSKN